MSSDLKPRQSVLVRYLARFVGIFQITSRAASCAFFAFAAVFSVIVVSPTKVTAQTFSEILDNSLLGCGVVAGNSCRVGGLLPTQNIPLDQARVCGTSTYGEGRSRGTQLCCVNQDSAYVASFNHTPALCDANIRYLEEEFSLEATGEVLLTEEQSFTFQLCQQIPDEDKKGECELCVGSGETVSNVWTAIGCIDTSQEGIVGAIVRLALGISGGVVLFKILGASLKLTVSKGEPKEVEEAREEITNAVIGLLFIVFSIVILEFIGISLLQIPGF